MSKKYTLRMNDGIIFEDIPEKICFQSKLLKSIIENTILENNIINLSTINSSTGKKVLRWMSYHNNVEPPIIKRPLTNLNLNSILKEWDINYIDVENDFLFDILNAANYLDIKPLLDLCCLKLASLIKNKKPEQIRQILNIQNDFTPEEEKELNYYKK